ncbi:MAG: UGSC family (seleno)protein [Methanobacterium sp.]
MKVNVVEKDVLNPLAEINKIKAELNPIPYDFESVSLLDNTKPGANVILKIIEENLGKRKFINIKKAAGSAATTKQLKIAANAEIVILALGDCGSCCSWVILDAIRLEKMGKPTISICSYKFLNFAHELAKAHGAKDLKILNIKHPVAGLSKEEVEEKALQIIPSLKYILQIP